jgi:hypothetical protein
LAVTGDVADDQHRAAAGGGERVVPVAADLEVLGGRDIAGGELQVLELRRIGQQAALQALGEVRHLA